MIRNIMNKLSALILILLLIGCSRPASKQFELPSVIGSGMVLQRNADIRLWGKASPGKKIEIVTTWGVRKAVKADKTGSWNISVKTDDAGGPYEIAFQTRDTNLVLKDILIGDVWLCSGQSNMEMPLNGWPPTDTIVNSANEIAAANYPMIRLFTVDRNTSTQPLDSCGGNWKVCTPETVASFSATAYFFGRELHRKLGIPVGLIHSSWGGTPAEAWTSKAFLKDFPVYKNIVDSFEYIEADIDSLMRWMNQLPKVTINNDDDNFYKSLNIESEALLKTEPDVANWPLMPVPSKWEDNVLPNFDGILWLCTNFSVPEDFIDNESILHLGPIDDMDITYINGNKIGEILELGNWKTERNYNIPARTLKKEQNTLAVQVIDIMGGGGIYGSEDITISNNSGKQIVLSGEWHYMPVAEIIKNTIYFFDDNNSYSSRPSMKISIGSHTPTTLYNAMIYPIIPYTIKGAIWYQGEANVGCGYEYRTLFPAMIASWREAWGQGDFSFYYVQIAPYEYWDEELSPAAELREAQFMALHVVNTGMVVTTDIGNPTNIHPANKQEVGRRLSLWALAKDYGFDTLVYSGPLYDTISIEGGKIIVHFTYADKGLISDGMPLSCFEIAGEDQQYFPAHAVITGNTIEVSSEQVTNPLAVRFGWCATAEPNLFNTIGLPASPFRSDNWKRLSE